MKKGLIYVFTGDGKGKTSAALGIAVRAVCAGKKVGWVSWYKGKDWPISEKDLPSRMIPEGRLKMYWLGQGFYKLPTDKATPKEHRQAAVAGLKQTEKLLGKTDVIVMDEAIKAVADGLVKEEELNKIIDKRRESHLILTGRGLVRSILAKADLVTECKKIKHPFDKGIKAIRGLDY